jgi:hypothetical protein
MEDRREGQRKAKRCASYKTKEGRELVPLTEGSYFSHNLSKLSACKD